MATVQNAERDKGIVPQPELFSIPQGEQVKEESSERVDPNKVEFIEEYGNPQQGEHKTPRKSTAYNKEEFKPSPTIKRIQEKMPKPHQKTSAWHTLSNAERDDLIAVEVRYRETTDKFNQLVHDYVELQYSYHEQQQEQENQLKDKDTQIARLSAKLDAIRILAQ